MAEVDRDMFRYPEHAPLILLAQEQRLREEFRKIGLVEGSRSWDDYRRAKEYFFAIHNEAVSGVEYDFYVRCLVEYLKL